MHRVGGNNRLMLCAGWQDRVTELLLQHFRHGEIQGRGTADQAFKTSEMRDGRIACRFTGDQQGEQHSQ